MTRIVKAWAPAVLWAVVIFFASSRPTIPVPLQGGMDKVAHFGAYAVLGALLGHAARTMRISPGWAAAVGLVYAASDEFHQSFVPGRYTDPADWLADALGVLAGLYFIHRLHVRASE